MSLQNTTPIDDILSLENREAYSNVTYVEQGSDEYGIELMRMIERYKVLKEEINNIRGKLYIQGIDPERIQLED